MKKHKNGGNHFCNDCQIDCAKLAKYKYHRLKKHGKWQKPFECKSCAKEFATKSNLTKHCKLTHIQGKAVSQSVLKVCLHRGSQLTVVNLSDHFTSQILLKILIGG